VYSPLVPNTPKSLQLPITELWIKTDQDEESSVRAIIKMYANQLVKLVHSVSSYSYYDGHPTFPYGIQFPALKFLVLTGSCADRSLEFLSFTPKLQKAYMILNLGG